MVNLGLLWGKVGTYVSAALLASVVVLGMLLWTTNLKLDNEKLGRANDQKSYAAAQKEAEVIALKYKLEKEEEYSNAQVKANSDYAALAGQFSASIVRLANSQGKARVDLRSLSEATPGTKVGDGSGVDPGFSEGSTDGSTLVVSTRDAEICAVNTARVIVTQEWAKEVGLIP